MVTETFINKHEIKNPSPHYNCLHNTKANTLLLTIAFYGIELDSILSWIEQLKNR